MGFSDSDWAGDIDWFQVENQKDNPPWLSPSAQKNDIKDHFIREAGERSDILLECIPSKVDVLTKSLPKDAHRDHCKNLGLNDIS